MLLRRFEKQYRRIFVTVLTMLTCFVSISSLAIEKPAFKAVLINSKVFEALLKKHPELKTLPAKVQEVLQSKNLICSALKLGCVLPIYVEGVFYPYDVSYGTSFYEFHPVLFRPYFQKMYPQWDRILEREGYYHLENLKYRDSLAIRRAFERFAVGKIGVGSLRRTVLGHPQGFHALSNVYSNYFSDFIYPLRAANLEKDKPALARRMRKLDQLGELISDALLLTLEGLWPLSDQGNRYKGFWRDGNQGHRDLLDVSWLYGKLHERKAWPQIRGLHQIAREESGFDLLGRISFKTKEGEDYSSWAQKGLYEESRKIVWIDYTDEFYENLYVLYHELGHVVWPYLLNHDVEGIFLKAFLKFPRSPESDKLVRLEVLKYLSTNELWSFMLQIRLFYNIGDVTQSWTPGQRSAQGWFDSYYGDEINDLYLSAEQRAIWRRAAAGESVEHEVFDKFVKIYARFEEHLESVESIQKTYSDNPWLALYRYNFARHSRFFDKLYLNSEFDRLISPDSIAVGLESLRRGELREEKPLAFSCPDLDRIKAALGTNWKWGVPFPESTGSHPENTGSHPESTGSHPELSGFPSLSAPLEILKRNEEERKR